MLPTVLVKTDVRVLNRFGVGIPLEHGRRTLAGRPDVVNDMNFTFSYGFQGNVVTNVSPELIAVIGVDDKNYDYTLTLKDLPAPRLKWEKVQNMDYGISGMLFNRKISFSFNGYYKKTKDMVINNEVPYENGVSSRPINGGQMSNSGWL